MVRTKIQLIAEFMHLDVALVFRFSFSDNMVVTYIANTMTFAYRSTMSQNVRRHIMSNSGNKQNLIAEHFDIKPSILCGILGREKENIRCLVSQKDAKGNT